MLKLKIKVALHRLIGMLPKEPHRISWRRKMTIDGIFWERIHYLTEEDGSNI